MVSSKKNLFVCNYFVSFFLFFISATLYAATPVYEFSIPVNGSRIINVQQIQALSFGSLLVAGSGISTVTTDGTYFVGGSIQITDNPRIGVPGIFVITLGSNIDIPSKTLSVILTTDGKISASNGRSIPLTIESINKKVVFSEVDGNETITIYIGGTIQIPPNTQQNSYTGLYNMNFELY